MISFQTALKIVIWMYTHLYIVFIAAGILLMVIPNSGTSIWACIGMIALGIVFLILKNLWKKRKK